MSNEEGDSRFPTMELLGAELERASAETGGRRLRPWLAAALCLLVAVALFGALTGPGRAVAERLGEIAGIGDDSTIDHAGDSGLEASGRGIVIASGSVPDGPAYEVVAYASKPSPSERESVGGAETATCLSIDFPDIETRGEFDTTCFGGGKRATLHTSSSTDYGPDAPFGERARYVISGETTVDVSEVKVTYLGADGVRVEAPVAYGVADEDVLDLIGAEYPGGEFVAFLPDDGAGKGGPPGLSPSVLDSVRVEAFAADGSLLAADNWGAQIAQGRENAMRQLDISRVCDDAADRDGQGVIPRLCSRLAK